MGQGSSLQAASPRCPLQVVHNSGTTAGAIAGIPSRNRGVFAQGTDTLAAVQQSIHQCMMGARGAEAQPAHPHCQTLATSAEPAIQTWSGVLVHGMADRLEGKEGQHGADCSNSTAIFHFNNHLRVKEAGGITRPGSKCGGKHTLLIEHI